MSEGYKIDLGSVNTEEDVRSVIKGSLPLPPHYGDNLDALYDVLTDGAIDAEVEIIWDPETCTPARGYIEKVIKTFRDAEDETDCLKVTVAEQA